MGLQFSLVEVQETDVFEASITHNLAPLADALCVHKCLWRPEEVGITRAHQLIDPLKNALFLLELAPEKYAGPVTKNGFGTVASM